MLTKVLLALLLALSLFSGPVETSWEALRHLPKHHIYTVLKSDGTCLTGSFLSTSNDEFVLAVPQLGDRSTPRVDVLRISAGESADIHATVYSARSSWADVQALHTPPYYSDLLVITTDERQFKGSLLGASSDGLTLIVDRQELKFAKEYVARVFLTSIKPTMERSGLHRGILSLPKKVLPTMQPVPLYEVTAREDNSPAGCSSTYRRQ